MFKLFLLALILVGIAVAGIAIKMFVVKNGQFKKQCSSLDPATGKAVGCTCKSDTEDQCHNG
jgi:hypothetical protein